MAAVTRPLVATSPSQRAGRIAEETACQHLLAHGHVWLDSNYHCRLGEIDLITLHGRDLVFTEVRWRRSESHGGALASVTRGKQQRIVRAARHFLMQHPAWQDRPVRFDVMAWQGWPPHWQLHWIHAAFTP